MSGKENRRGSAPITGLHQEPGKWGAREIRNEVADVFQERHHERALARDPAADPRQGSLQQGLASHDNRKLLRAVVTIQLPSERAKAHTSSPR